MSNHQKGWRGLAADLLASEATATQPIGHPQNPPSAASEVSDDHPSGVPSGKSRRRRSGEPFAATNQLVGLWLPHDMAAELRSRAERAGLSNSEFVREISRDHFNTSRAHQR